MPKKKVTQQKSLPPSHEPVSVPKSMARFKSRVQDRVHELRGQARSEFAFRLIERLLCRFSPEPDWLYLKGCCSMDLGWFALGAESFAAATFFQPENVEFRLSLANSLLLSGEDTKGMSLIREVLKKSPEHFHAHMLLGQHFEQLQNWRNALSHYERIKPQTDQPGYPQLLCHLALCEMHLGHERQALEHLEEAYRLDGDDPEILFAKGVANGHMGEYETALIDMEEVIKRQPADPEALAYSAMFLHMLGQKPQAVARLEMAIELAPESIIVRQTHEDIFSGRAFHPRQPFMEEVD